MHDIAIIQVADGIKEYNSDFKQEAVCLAWKDHYFTKADVQKSIVTAVQRSESRYSSLEVNRYTMGISCDG